MRTGGRPRGITHTLGTADQRPRDAIGGIATAFRGRNVNRHAASRAVVRVDGVDGRSRREWEREAQVAALSIILAEQSHRLFPSAITSPSIYSPPRFSPSLPRARAQLPSRSAVSIRSLFLRSFCSRSRDVPSLFFARSEVIFT